ncbi:hypothetical protein AAIR98_001464 [Elusimicrobium simillimum]
MKTFLFIVNSWVWGSCFIEVWFYIFDLNQVIY